MVGFIRSMCFLARFAPSKSNAGLFDLSRDKTIKCLVQSMNWMKYWATKRFVNQFRVGEFTMLVIRRHRANLTISYYKAGLLHFLNDFYCLWAILDCSKPEIEKKCRSCWKRWFHFTISFFNNSREASRCFVTIVETKVLLQLKTFSKILIKTWAL